jgi:hypothetical protein
MSNLDAFCVFLTVMQYFSSIFSFVLKYCMHCWGRILGSNWDKLLRVFLLAIHCHLYKRILSPPPLSKSGSKLVCIVNIVYDNLKSENSQDYAQKPQRNCTIMNSACVDTSIFLY